MIYAQNTWYITTTGTWHATIVASTAEQAIQYAWGGHRRTRRGRSDIQIRTVEKKSQVLVREGSL